MKQNLYGRHDVHLEYTTDKLLEKKWQNFVLIYLPEKCLKEVTACTFAQRHFDGNLNSYKSYGYSRVKDLNMRWRL